MGEPDPVFSRVQDRFIITMHGGKAANEVAVESNREPSLTIGRA